MAKLGVECGVGLTAMGQAQVCYRRPASLLRPGGCRSFSSAATLAWQGPRSGCPDNVSGVRCGVDGK